MLLSDVSRKWKKDVTSYRTIMDSLWEGSRVCEALDLCLEMTGKGIQPNL